jgi:hypothetical protein
MTRTGIDANWQNGFISGDQYATPYKSINPFAQREGLDLRGSAQIASALAGSLGLGSSHNDVSTHPGLISGALPGLFVQPLTSFD